jgi:hypothetical protein
MPRKRSTDSLQQTTTCNITHNTGNTAVSNWKPELVEFTAGSRGEVPRGNKTRNEMKIIIF